MSSELGQLKDHNDLYDNEVLKIRLVTHLLRLKFGDKELFDSHTGLLRRKQFEEIQKWTEEELFKAGLRGTFVIDVQNGNPTIDVWGRVDDAPEHKYGMDHEKKRDEVIKANERGERYLGESGKK
jgi:hypothetical protein